MKCQFTYCQTWKTTSIHVLLWNSLADRFELANQDCPHPYPTRVTVSSLGTVRILNFDFRTFIFLENLGNNQFPEQINIFPFPTKISFFDKGACRCEYLSVVHGMRWSCHHNRTKSTIAKIQAIEVDAVSTLARLNHLDQIHI